MSSQFWINLLISFLVLVAALVAINHSKIRFIRRIRAARLRQRIIPKVNDLLPIIINESNEHEPDLFSLFRLKVDLEQMLSKADVLFEIERLALTDFLTRLSSQTAKIDAGSHNNNDIEELILSGQRVINEVTELGRNNH